MSLRAGYNIANVYYSKWEFPKIRGVPLKGSIRVPLKGSIRVL